MEHIVNAALCSTLGLAFLGAGALFVKERLWGPAIASAVLGVYFLVLLH